MYDPSLITPEITQEYKGYENFRPTVLSKFLDQTLHKTVLVISGNRGGKTGSVAKHYVDRVMGICDVPEKNKLARKVRCMSSSLPEAAGEDEDDNAQYIELIKRLPPSMIEKNITARAKNLVVRRPLGLNTQKTIFEFRSSKQEVQDLGKIDLSSVWHDEETPKIIREECRVRLVEEDGDEIFTLTAVNPLSWTFESLYQRAEEIRRTKTICDVLGLLPLEYPLGNKGSGIVCFEMATDDNPVLSKSAVDRIFSEITDPDDLALRRYGVFKQKSGRVHKTYDPRVNFISMDRYFPTGVPYRWFHARGIDYHESRTPWSIGWVSASPEDEWFLWQEFHPAIDGRFAMNTYDIVKSMARKSQDYYYTLNLIDPLANKKQANTLFSTTDDINRYFDLVRSESGVGTPCFWQGWDTKGTTGRDEVSKRFKNASKCGVPFNNSTKEHGINKRLPTLWVMDTCPRFNKSLVNWAYGEYATNQTRMVNDPKKTPTQKNSHDCMVLEGLAKDQRLLHAAHMIKHPPKQAGFRRRSITGSG